MSQLPCRIVLQGELSDHFLYAFPGLTLRREGEYTKLTGSVADQAQLHSVLNQLFDFGLLLVSVHTGPGATPNSHHPVGSTGG